MLIIGNPTIPAKISRIESISFSPIIALMDFRMVLEIVFDKNRIVITYSLNI